MKWVALIVVAVGALALASMAFSGRIVNADTTTRVPILVELFTSEGCSSCPPADALLQKFDRQPVPGAELIVMSEHVDYWNQIGWKDPFSSHFYSDRQSAYANRFGLNTVYTPQMVVDGETEFTGSEPNSAQLAIEKALRSPKLTVRLSSLKLDDQNHLRAWLEVEGSAGKGEIFVALALEHAESQVLRGENAGRALSHAAVVKTIAKVGDFKSTDKFSKAVDLKLDPVTGSQKLRMIAFVQERGMRKILGATQQPFSK